MNQIDNNKKTIFGLFTFGLISFFLTLTEVLTNYNGIITLVISVVSVILSLYLCYIYRYNVGLFLVMLFIAYTNYSITVGVYLDTSIRPQTIYAQFTGEHTYGIGIMCIYIFLVSLTLLSYKNIINPRCIDCSIKKKDEYNEIIAVVSPLIFLAVFLMNFTINSDGTRGGSSALGEYRIIFFIIGSYYSGNRKVFKYIWTIIVLITTILIFISKNRVDSFPAIIFLITFWYPSTFNVKRILTLLPFFVIMMVSLGAFRSSSNPVGGFRPIQIVERIVNDKLTYDGAIYAYMPAMATIELSSKTALADKCTILLQHIIYIFKIGSAGTSSVSLSSWSRQYYVHCNGFISPIYFYFWFGYVGAIIFALLVNMYKSLYLYAMNKDILFFKDKSAYLLSMYFICNVARWYEYGPMPLLRGMFLFFVVICLAHFVDTITSRRTVDEDSLCI